MRRRVRPERQPLQVLQASRPARPSLSRGQASARRRRGDPLDPAEHVGQLVRLADRQAQSAAAEEYGRDAVSRTDSAECWPHSSSSAS